jgi:hypothetical protein
MKYLPYEFRIWLATILGRLLDQRYRGSVLELFSDGARRGVPRLQCIAIEDSLLNEFTDWYATQRRMHLRVHRHDETADTSGSTQFIGGGEYFAPISSDDFTAWCAGEATPAESRWPLNEMVEWLRGRHTRRVISFRTLVEYPVRHFIANRLAPKRRGPRA